MDASLHFASNRQTENGAYRLLELPPDLVALLQSSSQNQWTIRGRSGDDAVLCTQDKTYNIRTVTLSNAICVLTPPSSGEEGDAVIRKDVHEILEIQPAIPKLHRLNGLLRGQEYDEMVEQGNAGMDVDGDTVEQSRYSYESVRSQVQASDVELTRGLKDQRILTIDGYLRPIAPGYLNTILELLLNTLISQSQQHNSAAVTDIAHVLSADHEIARNVTLQVMSWFGDLQGVHGDDYSKATWRMDVPSVVKQMGVGLLIAHRTEPLERDEFVKRWKRALGESFEDQVDLSLLAGNYVMLQASTPQKLKYFASADLPPTPAERFGELFLAQTRWKKSDIVPFLKDIALDEKECEKLLMKFTRMITDSDGIAWYTSRGGTMI